MRADNTPALLAAAQRRREQTLARAEVTLAEVEAAGEAITVSQLATRAGVSRAWLYTQPALRDRLEQLPARTPEAAAAPPGEAASRTSLQRRLDIAHASIRQLKEENARLREQLSRALGERRNRVPPKGVPPAP